MNVETHGRASNILTQMTRIPQIVGDFYFALRTRKYVCGNEGYEILIEMNIRVRLREG